MSTVSPKYSVKDIISDLADIIKDNNFRGCGR